MWVGRKKNRTWSSHTSIKYTISPYILSNEYLRILFIFAVVNNAHVLCRMICEEEKKHRNNAKLNEIIATMRNVNKKWVYRPSAATMPNKSDSN